MIRINLLQGDEKKTLYCKSGEKLSSVLAKNQIITEHTCGGKGICKKCVALINGKSELMCRYLVGFDITVEIPKNEEITFEKFINETNVVTKNVCLCLDIGTTTLVMALVSFDDKSIIKTISKTNPQKVFGADVISRIEHCTKNGFFELKNVLINTINLMVGEMLGETNIEAIEKMYVAGNTTMLHLLFGFDCSSLGKAPYTPLFLDKKTVSAKSIGVNNIKTIISLPNLSAFVGADIVAGLNYLPLPNYNKYALLVDLGTNAEIVLFSKQKIVSATAAAGPCFEGANISCGMSAIKGAIFSYKQNGECSVIGDSSPRGICGTGLIDIVAELLKKEIIDETGFLADDKFKIAENVFLSKDDVRQFQLAKSAVFSAIVSLKNIENIAFDDIETLYVSGGFSSKMNIANSVFVGLFPKELKEKIKTINNSSLQGLIKFAHDGERLNVDTKKAEYIDLSSNAMFSEIFIENMCFEN